MPSRRARTASLRIESVMHALLTHPTPGAATGSTALYPPSPRSEQLTGRPADPEVCRRRIRTCLSPVDVPHGFDPTLILVLNLAGTFVFGISGGLAAARAKLDLFGRGGLAAGVGLAGGVGLGGGITRDLLIFAPPATFRDWRYLAAAGAAGLVCFFGRPALERVQRSVLVFDAVGLGLFCVTGATKALDFGVGAVSAILLGAITGVGGGMLRDVLLREIPTILRHDLYAIPALIGAGILVIAQEAGAT